MVAPGGRFEAIEGHERGVLLSLHAASVVMVLYLIGVLLWGAADPASAVKGAAAALGVLALCVPVELGWRPRWALARVALPLVAWPILYDATTRIVQLAPERYVDAVLVRADTLLLGGWIGVPTTWPLGGPLEEAANLFYVSYYAAVPLGAVWLWRRRGEGAAIRYGAAVLSATALCALVWLAFPSGGYHLSGSPETPPWGPFTALARGVYTVHPHFAAAFPSSHVAVALVVGVALARASSRRLVGLIPLVWAAGVAWSTLQGQYHYLVDVPSGLAVGGVALWMVGDRRRVVPFGPELVPGFAWVRRRR